MIYVTCLDLEKLKSSTSKTTTTTTTTTTTSLTVYTMKTRNDSIGEYRPVSIANLDEYSKLHPC